MRNIKVDTTGLTFKFAGTCAPVAEYKDGVRQEGQSVNENGTPVWRVSVSINNGETIETNNIKVASATEPQLVLDAPVVITGLVATPVANGGNVNVYLAAESLAPVRGKD